MRPRSILILAVCAVAAAVFVRLGVWQVQRLKERRALNAQVAARLARPVVPVESLPADTAGVRFRRVEVRGSFDYAHELRLVGRSYEGSPGVYVLTPVRVAGTDTGVLVNRGWAYSPDGASLEMERWREGDTARFTGFVEVLPPSAAGAAPAGATDALRRLDSAELARRVPYPLRPWYVVRMDTAPPRRDRLATLSPPPLDEGPHRSYAIQWFAFAAIAIVGGILLVRTR